MADGMTAPLYTREILRLAAAIPGQVRFEELEDRTELRSPTCGSRIRVTVETGDDGQVITVRQAVEACAFGQAAASLMATHAIGRDVEDIRRAVAGIEAWLGGREDAADSWPDLGVLAPAQTRKGRHGAILLPFRALLAAIEAPQ
jgi:NifU-like protein involved in Fe-S cluster formation